jgi:DNA repair exonuclease SbcCD nuclease subunit
VKLVHAADLHIDSPLRGLERYEGAPVGAMRGATRRAVENLVAVCIEERASLLVLAGDLYDGDWKDYATGLFFAQQMARLAAADIPVAWIRGNHDAASRISRHLGLPANVRELDTRAPETVVYEALGVAVHGQGFAQRAVTTDLAARYPDPIRGVFNVGLLHTSADGKPGHEPYAPCSPDALADKGYDYWALGHVHAREVLSRDPWICFSGNLQGRHARETGPKGALFVTVREGAVTDVALRAVDAARWARAEVDASAAASAHDVVDLAREALEGAAAEAEGRPVAARLLVRGASRAHDALADDPDRWETELRALANETGEVWLERVVMETVPAMDPAELELRDDAVGQVARTLAALKNDEAALGALRERIDELVRKLPSELRTRETGELELRMDDRASLRHAVAEVERVLLPRLLAAARG